MRIPKKVTDRYTKSVRKYQKILKVAIDRDVNESDTVAILNDIFADVFGYDKYNDLTSEFVIKRHFCDLAVKIDGKVHLLIEAKAVGFKLKDSSVTQVVNYGANQGNQWVVLTNGVEWRLYRIKFGKPIKHELVCSFDFTTLNAKSVKDQELLFLISKEGLSKNAKEEFFDKVQSVNRFTIGSLILSEPVLSAIRRELRKFAGSVKVSLEDVEQLVRDEVLKREITSEDEASAAQKKVAKFYRKNAATKRKAVKENPEPKDEQPNVPGE